MAYDEEIMLISNNLGTGDTGAEPAGRCPKCHAPVDADAVFCTSCGQSLR